MSFMAGNLRGAAGARAALGGARGGRAAGWAYDSEAVSRYQLFCASKRYRAAISSGAAGRGECALGGGIGADAAEAHRILEQIIRAATAVG